MGKHHRPRVAAGRSARRKCGQRHPYTGCALCSGGRPLYRAKPQQRRRGGIARHGDGEAQGALRGPSGEDGVHAAAGALRVPRGRRGFVLRTPGPRPVYGGAVNFEPSAQAQEAIRENGINGAIVRGSHVDECVAAQGHGANHGMHNLRNS